MSIGKHAAKLAFALAAAGGLIVVLGAAVLPEVPAEETIGYAPSVQRRASTVPAEPETLTMNFAGCDILVLWHTYRGALNIHESQVRVRGALKWTTMRVWRQLSWVSNGRVFNMGQELRQERCDRRRRYRFRIYAPDSTGAPIRSNEPYAGTERWLYFPSRTGWTTRTKIDLGYLDRCIVDGTKCGKPYYPSGPTPVLKPE